VQSEDNNILLLTLFFDDNITCCVAVDFIDADLQSGRDHRGKNHANPISMAGEAKKEEKEAEGNDRRFD
jgi:hypothetical protein